MIKKKIGDLLIEKGYINQEQLDVALKEQLSTGKRLGSILIEKGVITEEQLTSCVSERLAIPKVSLSSMVIHPHVIQRVNVELARRYILIPIFYIGNTLTIAMADPLNIIAIDQVKYQTGCEIKRAIASSSEIKAAIEKYYSVADSLNEFQDKNTQDKAADLSSVIKLNHQTEELETPIIKLVTMIISKAVNEKASDIHIEPDEDTVRIRYRVNGVMREEAAPPKSIQNEVISRIKIMADLDVSEKRLPQDGRFIANVDGNIIDLRVSTLPTIHGEKIVLRVLDRRSLYLSFRELGFSEHLQKEWLNVVYKPEGLVLISGPTSSGKTSTLYTTLQEINSIEKNIITVEDPVEYSLPLINQIQINEKAGLNFPSTLRAILRQNPDILMIGEIRDIETARMAIRSSLTGHLVFSTIHTNDAASTITRLLDMGIENYLVTSALKGVLSQRLVRTNCPHCLESYRPTENVLERAGLLQQAGEFNFRKGYGCNQCRGTGFKNLTGVFEFIKITPEITELILSNASLNRIIEAAYKSGFKPLFEAGLEKVKEGSVCLEELLKETSHLENSPAPEPIKEGSLVNAGQI
ncbi:MAG: ATPase, T2SS/T4P/T4SS family [candidate division Zixibacteria bacterium]|nr:ATPase, T2SS/T4P/T4SS family [candidate division Zixibacteria bacterium]MDD5425381.1 ATPase, T2SS/T4P/T4SS family [candidate division Zixibacteria bacterium]